MITVTFLQYDTNYSYKFHDQDDHVCSLSPWTLRGAYCLPAAEALRAQGDAACL